MYILVGCAGVKWKTWLRDSLVFLHHSPFSYRIRFRVHTHLLLLHHQVVGDNDSRGLNHKRIDERNPRKNIQVVGHCAEQGHQRWWRDLWKITADSINEKRTPMRTALVVRTSSFVYSMQHVRMLWYREEHKFIHHDPDKKRTWYIMNAHLFEFYMTLELI